MSAVTGANGSYSIKVKAGIYDVAVFPVPEDYEDPGPVRVTVAPGQVAIVNFKLTRKGTVSGVVTDDEGTPLSGITVTVTSAP